MASPKAMIIQASGMAGTGEPLRRDSIDDAGITDGFDFRSDYSLNGVGLAAGKVFKNLTINGADATITSDFAAVDPLYGLKKSGAGQLRLPDTFKFAANTTHFAVGIWFRQDLTAKLVSKIAGLAGYTYGNQTAAQWLFRVDVDANGAATNVYWMANGVATSSAVVAAAVNDGKMHQIWGEWEVINGATQQRHTLYLDGLPVAQNVSAFSGALLAPVTGSPSPVIAVTVVSSITDQMKGWYGRIKAKNFSVGGATRTTADIVAAEWAKYGPAGANRYGAG